jgi:hypothetical protein
MEVDKTGSDDEIAAVDNFGVGAALFRGNFPVDDEKIPNLITIVGGIDNAAVANDHVHCAEIPPQR